MTSRTGTSARQAKPWTRSRTWSPQAQERGYDTSEIEALLAEGRSKLASAASYHAEANRIQTAADGFDGRGQGSGSRSGPRYLPHRPRCPGECQRCLAGNPADRAGDPGDRAYLASGLPGKPGAGRLLAKAEPKDDAVASCCVAGPVRRTGPAGVSTPAGPRSAAGDRTPSSRRLRKPRSGAVASPPRMLQTRIRRGRMTGHCRGQEQHGYPPRRQRHQRPCQASRRPTRRRRRTLSSTR